jgi:hypothetical protein
VVDTVSSLYKFCSLDAGLKILNSQTLRWSAPHLFGDPFELSYLSDPQISGKELLDVLLREALIMLFGPEEPTGRHNRLVSVMARWREQQKFIDEDQAHEVLRDLLGQIADIQAQKVKDYLREWHSYATLARIVCLSESVDSLPCWDRFADQHQGLALRFNCGADTHLPNPQRMTYGAQAAVITHKQEQLEIIYGRRNSPLAEEFHTKLLMKSRHQAGELEWRCFDQGNEEDRDSDPSLWYDNWRFPAHELRGVYCGARMPEETRNQIARLLRASYPNARLYQAQPLAGRYELEFTAVKS